MIDHKGCQWTDGIGTRPDGVVCGECSNFGKTHCSAYPVPDDDYKLKGIINTRIRKADISKEGLPKNNSWVWYWDGWKAAYQDLKEIIEYHKPELLETTIIEKEPCSDCVHKDVCTEINNLKCRDQFIWYNSTTGCPHYMPISKLQKLFTEETNNNEK